MSALPILIGLVMVAAGIAAYTGRWRSWARPGRGFGTMGGLALTYIGAALIVGAGGIVVFPASDAGFWVTTGVAAALLLIGFVGLWWLPRFLRPAWYQRARGDDHQRRGARR